MPRLGFSSLLFLLWIPTRIWACLQCDTEFKSNIAKLRTDVVPKKIRDTRLKARAEVLLRGLEGDFFLHYATSQFSGLAVKAMVDALLQEVKVTTEKLLLTNSTDEDLLENLVEFRSETTMKLKKALKKHQIQGCDEKICGSLTYAVINCKRCLPAGAYCLSLSQCFGLVRFQNSIKPLYVKSLCEIHRALEGSSQHNKGKYLCGSQVWLFQTAQGKVVSVDNQDRLALRFGEPLVDPDIARTGVAIVLCMGGVLFLVIMGTIIVYWRSQLYRYV